VSSKEAIGDNYEGTICASMLMYIRADQLEAFPPVRSALDPSQVSVQVPGDLVEDKEAYDANAKSATDIQIEADENLRNLRPSCWTRT
jgi:hypothetical protein